jgi:YggT family protein
LRGAKVFVLSNFLQAVAKVLDWVLRAYMLVVIGSVIISWVDADPLNPIVRLLRQATEPVFDPLRPLIPTADLGIDFSPLIVLLAVYFARAFLVRSIMDLAVRLRGSSGSA